MLGLMMAICLSVIYAYSSLFGVLNHISRAKEVRPTTVNAGPPPALLQQPFNVLIIGVDLRNGQQPGNDVNSDTLIVAHVDPLEQWASLLSIPRDTLATIPHSACGSATKINAAYACGYKNPQIYGRKIDPEDSAAALAADTVEDYLGITINYTAQVNFDGFQKLLDTIGGITIDVPRAILDAEYPTEDYGYMRLYIPAGLQHMDGKTALRYARTRHVDNDFGRAKRQQQVLQAILDTIKRQGILERFEATPQMLQVLSETIRTTLPLNDIGTLRGLAELAQNLHADRIQQFVLKPERNPDGSPNLLSDLSSTLEWDPAYIQRVVEQFQSSPDTAVGGAGIIQVQNGTQVRGLAAQLTSSLDMHGFKTVPAAEAPAKNIPLTVILDYTGQKTTARQLAQFLNIDERYIQDVSNQNPPPNVDVVVLLGRDYTASIDMQTLTH